MLALVDQPPNETTAMPAPEDLTVHTPGEPIAPDANEQTAANDSLPPPPDDLAQAAPVFTAKHNGGGRYIVIDAQGDKVGDFVGDKTSAEAEAERMNAGGEPYVAATAPVKQTQAAPVQQAAKAAGVNPETLKQPVLTSEGWLCPEPPAAKV